MKKLSVLAMAMIVMASCAKENVQPNNEPNGEKALLEIGLASTKTQLGTEDKVNKLFPILWSEGDEIAVIENMGVEGQNVLVYRLKEGAGTANGVFELVEGSPKVTNNVDVVYPASAVKGEELITDISLLVPKDQTQIYEDGNFDPNAAVMHFHGDIAADKILLQPLSSIICIPIKGFDDNDVVTAVKWQNMDGRTATVTLNCPNGVKLSKGQATNFYLSIQPMLKDCNGIAYVYLKNGAIQVKTPRNLKKFEAGTLHRFPEWTLSKKAKWTIKYIGSERKTSVSNQTPLGLGQYMIDGNDLSWWEFRRNSTGSMAGPHKVIIDLGKTEHIKGLKIKGPETKKTSSYTVKDEFGENTITVSNGYNAPAIVFASFLKEGQLTNDYIKDFGTTASFESKAEEKFYAIRYSTEDNKYNIIDKSITDCYGSKMEKYWELPLSNERDARYLVIHFFQCWNDAATAGAANKMKVAELDIY
ncbi:MAG: hypothetical protein SPG52_08775 [Candidatus Cryptobacteroides sp.]|nr:hypothetical protein [Candidatus Cryptobacteroides sp.]